MIIEHRGQIAIGDATIALLVSMTSFGRRAFSAIDARAGAGWQLAPARFQASPGLESRHRMRSIPHGVERIILSSSPMAHF